MWRIALLAIAANCAWGFPVANRSAAAKTSLTFLQDRAESKESGVS